MKTSCRVPTINELRKFCLLMAGIFGLSGIVSLYLSKWFWPILMVCSIFLLITGILRPLFFSRPYVWWMNLADFLNRITTTVILTLFFFLAVVPVGLLARLGGKRFMDLGPDPNCKSYWIQRNEDRPHGQSLEKQY